MPKRTRDLCAVEVVGAHSPDRADLRSRTRSDDSTLPTNSLCSVYSRNTAEVQRALTSLPLSSWKLRVTDWWPNTFNNLLSQQELVLSATEAKHSSSAAAPEQPAQRERFPLILSCHLGLAYGFRSSRLRACPRECLKTDTALNVGFTGTCSDLRDFREQNFSLHRATVLNHSSGAQGMRDWSLLARNTTLV